MQIFSFALIFSLVFAAPDKPFGTKTGVFMNSVLVIGPDAHVSLYNAGDEEVDVSGWSLNHENSEAKKGDWILPQGTSIGAGESLVIANSASGYKKAHGKSPDLEIATGEGVTDDEDVTNVVSAEGAGLIRSITPVERNAMECNIATGEGPFRSLAIWRPCDDTMVRDVRGGWNNGGGRNIKCPRRLRDHPRRDRCAGGWR